MNSTFNGRAYVIQNCRAAHCLSEILRFEVRPGDMAAIPDTGERNEIATLDRFIPGQKASVTFDLIIEPGYKDAVPNNWVCLAQYKGATNPSRPPLALELTISKDGFEEFRITSRDRNNAYRRLYSERDHRRGVWYRFEIIVQGGLNGGVTVKRGTYVDDTTPPLSTLVSFTGDIGPGDMLGYYWKTGIYRAPSQVTLATQVRNLKVDPV